jgi:signal transduction histidine kinase
VNAHQGRSADGKVTVGVAAAGPRELRIQIHNDGATIPEENADLVFEPFFTTRATGTGLGLAVVRRLLDDLEGRVTLDPCVTGTAFSLWVPVATDARTS